MMIVKVGLERLNEVASKNNISTGAVAIVLGSALKEKYSDYFGHNLEASI